MSIDDLLSKLSADTDSTNTLHMQLAETISQGQTLTQSFQELGAEAVASTVIAGTSQVEEAQSLASALADKLQEAHTTFETAKQHLTGGSPAGSATTGATRAIVGDPITAPEPKPGPNSLIRELDNPDDGDAERTKRRKTGRGLSRNAESIKKQVDEHAKTVEVSIDQYNRGGSDGTSAFVETVGIDAHRSTVSGNQPQYHGGDLVLPVVAGGAAIFGIVGSFRKYRNKREQ